MRSEQSSKKSVLTLRVGEMVEVRGESEILQTLDAYGRLDALPFMPEMLQYCGKRFTVYKRADKTCDTIEKTGCRRMQDAVHLAELRCDGAFHGGCEAGCLLFWKEAWLKRVDSGASEPSSEAIGSMRQDRQSLCTVETLRTATRSVAVATTLGDEDEVFSCQATALRQATSYLSPWDYRHYLRDLRAGNRTLGAVLHAIFLELFAAALRIGGYNILIRTFNAVQRLRGKGPYPYRSGKLQKTPASVLNLQPGDLVQIKTHEEILQTLNSNNKNRGLWFDVEMVKYCEGKYKVRRKVHKIIHEHTGKMINLQNDCLVLEGVTCVGDYHQLCPRNSLPYWREVWLKKVE